MITCPETYHRETIFKMTRALHNRATAIEQRLEQYLEDRGETPENAVAIGRTKGRIQGFRLAADMLERVLENENNVFV